jgi:hypothetical protein
MHAGLPDALAVARNRAREASVARAASSEYACPNDVRLVEHAAGLHLDRRVGTWKEIGHRLAIDSGNDRVRVEREVAVKEKAEANPDHFKSLLRRRRSSGLDEDRVREFPVPAWQVGLRDDGAPTGARGDDAFSFGNVEAGPVAGHGPCWPRCPLRQNRRRFPNARARRCHPPR